LLCAFGATEREAVASYRRFVADGKKSPNPWDQLKHQVFLGSESFVERVRRQLPPDPDLSEIPIAQR